MKIKLFLVLFLFGYQSLHANDASEALEVEFFEAVKNQQIDAAIYPRNSLESRVVIKNIADVPLNIRLPETFAGVPVLAQRASGAGGNSGQAVGGGFGGGGRGGGQNELDQSREVRVRAHTRRDGTRVREHTRSRPSFNLLPDKVIRQTVKTVCLEHGKDEPRRHMKYELKPLESVTTKKEVHLLCSLVGSDMIEQKAAQAAVWHYINNMSWNELAAKSIVRRAQNPSRIPYFSKEEISYARRLGQKVEEEIKKRDQKEKNRSDTSY